MTAPNSLPLFRLISLTTLSLIAFAANSILCRYALAENAIDAGSFTSLRLISGALMLVLLLTVFPLKTASQVQGSWLAGFMLFVYAAAFSYGYLVLGAAVGTLILFGAVQLSMILFSLWKGHPFHLTEWFGLLLAFLGLIYLVLPGISAPPFHGALLMTIAGSAWAAYTLLGKTSSQPLADTRANFLRACPFALVLLYVYQDTIFYTSNGILLAICSGAITSALGYVIWYRALRELTATQAAVIQLLVPVIAAFGGILLLSETVTLRFLLATLFILGGIALVILGRRLGSLRSLR